MICRFRCRGHGVGFVARCRKAQQAKPETIPRFQPEPFWPKPLPDNWVLGQVSGIAVDGQDNIWIIHRPATLLDDEKGAQKNPPETKCCIAAPPVLKFDAEGNLLASWGGPNAGHPWVKNEHGIHVDHDGNVWVGGNNDGDQILKFTPDGKFLQQIGKDDGTKGSMSTTRLGRPAHMMTDAAAGEIYVADGYGNRRVIVFDSKTGEFKRLWGAYGTKTPTDDKLPAYTQAAEPSKSFGNPVHCVRLSNDNLVYVCDRTNNRIQMFRKDGTFVKEFRVTTETSGERLGLGPRALRRPAAEVHLRRRRRQRADRHAVARDRRGPRAMGPPRPPARAIQVGPQHRHRQQGQSLYRRGRLRPPRAEVQERWNEAAPSHGIRPAKLLDCRKH